MLSYGSIVWGHILDSKWAFSKVTSLQRASFKLLTFFRKSTPTLGLEVITNTWPVDLFVKNVQVAGFLRTRGHEKYSENEMYTEVPCLKGHRQRIEEWLYKIGCNAHFVTTTSVDDNERRFIWEKKYKIDLESVNSKSEHYGVPRFDTDFAIYTDGSKDDEKTGGGQ